VFIYAALGLLYGLNLRDVVAPQALRRFYLAINAVSLGVGFAVALALPWAGWLLVTYYSAFYQELVPNMVGLRKPVLTFGTHSMAGFMIYLLFYMAFSSYRRRQDVSSLLIACLHAVLLVALSSTTSMVYAAVALLQLVGLALARVRRLAVPLVAVALVAAVAGMLVFERVSSAIIDRAGEALVGDKIRGLASRYATDGLLAGNLSYLAEHPLEPVGFAFSERLYFGDSGYVVNMLRGSVPLVAAVYGGLFLFLWTNLRAHGSAVWLFIVIAAFEVGFTPLHYFRFLGFAPFMVVYLNSLDAEARAEERIHSDE
jgi:hypothetical protein